MEAPGSYRICHEQSELPPSAAFVPPDTNGKNGATPPCLSRALCSLLQSQSLTTWCCEYERIHLSMGQPDFCSYFYLLLQCFPKCWPQVMLKAIGVAFRSVMFALLLLLGLVYVFAIAALLHLGIPTLGATVLIFLQWK